IKVQLAQDGTFTGVPELLRASGGRAADQQALFRAGRRALLNAQRAGAFKHLPLEKYNAWKIIAIVFTPDEIGFSSMP
ncbi:MAG: hypothetical protein ACU0B1_01285, partial [Thermohalobaculum sp.]